MAFLHGVEVIEVDSGPRPIQTVRSSVIGIVGTAPKADATAFPLNTPVLIAGSKAEAAKLYSEAGADYGTLPLAIDKMLDQIGAVIVVVRVEASETEATELANIIGGVNAGTGAYTGVSAFLGAESAVGVTPRVLVAPGYTGDRLDGGVLSTTITAPGADYTAATVAITGDGTGATATATVTAGAVTAITITNPGSGYTSATVAISGDGTGATATAAVGDEVNAVVTALVPIAERLKAVIIADGPNTNDAAAIAWASDWGSRRVFVVDPSVTVLNTLGETAVNATLPASAVVAGLIARVDNERGFWTSPSNNVLNGVLGTTRLVDFTLGDPNSRANLLNEDNVATIIRQQGFRLWGNRTLSSDLKWAFLSVVRTADIINDSILRAHLWAVDRGITRTYLQDVTDSVNAYLRDLVGLGAILGGTCWPDPDLNTPSSIANGQVWFNFDFTPPYPAERVTFRSELNNSYLANILE